MGIFRPNIDKLKAGKNVRGLIKALRNKDNNIQDEVTEALVEIGEPAIRPLIQVLKNEDDRNTLQVGLRVLERIGKPSEELLIKAAMDWVKKACSLTDMGNHEEAIKCYDKALGLGGDNHIIFFNKANCLYKLHRFNESIACYDKALELCPEHADSWYSKGIVLGTIEAHEDAMKCFDRALMINPEDTGALAGKATVLTYLREPEEAEKLFEKALKINPNDKKITEQLGITRLISAISKIMLSDIQHNVLQHNVLFGPTNEGYILTISAHLLKDYSPNNMSPTVKGPYTSKEALYSFIKRRIAEIYRVVFNSAEIRVREAVVECRHGVRHYTIGGSKASDTARTIYSVSINGNKAAKFDWTKISFEEIQKMWSVRIDIIPTIQIQHGL